MMVSDRVKDDGSQDFACQGKNTTSISVLLFFLLPACYRLSLAHTFIYTFSQRSIGSHFCSTVKCNKKPTTVESRLASYRLSR
jgi:hypothetical protein